MPAPLEILQPSVERLAELVRPLDDEAIVAQAYPTAWTIAQVMSHLGSGAVIFARRIQDALDGVDTPDDHAPGVWAEWDAKAPRAQVDDSLAADAALLAQLLDVPAADRERFQTTFGPMQLDWDGIVGMRANEHLLHEWDIAVVLDESATLPADGAAHVADQVGQLVAFSGRPTGGPDTVVIATTHPDGAWAVTTREDGVSLDRIETWDDVHVTMPTESLVRLVYGRLDPEHTPDQVEGDDAVLDRLRATFPGF